MPAEPRAGPPDEPRFRLRLRAWGQARPYGATSTPGLAASDRVTDRDQNATVRELLRDVLEVVRAASAETRDPAARALWQRTRETIAATLREHDDFASKPERPLDA